MCWFDHLAAWGVVLCLAAVADAQPTTRPAGPRGLFNDARDEPTTRPTIEEPAPPSRAPAPGMNQSGQPRPLPADQPPKAPATKPSTKPLPAATRHPIPSTAELAQAHRLVRETFKKDYARREPGQPDFLANEMLRMSDDASEKPSVRYALLEEARDLAATAGNYKLARRSVDALAAGWEVDGGALRRELLAVAASTVDPRSVPELLADALPAIDEAIDRGDLETARALATAAETATLRGSDKSQIAQARSRWSDVQILRQEAARGEEAVRSLAAKPTDATLNVIAGKHLCFSKGQWTQGLALLAKGADDPVKAIAVRDLAGAPTPDGKLVIGDSWMEYARTLPSPYAQRQASRRAEHWYLSVLSGAQGLVRTAAMKRLVTLPPNVSMARLAERWEEPRHRTNLSSMTRSGGKPDHCSSPGLLIGFTYATGNLEKRPMIKMLRPIYLTADGRQMGQQFGVLRKTGKPQEVLTTEAKAGYAVGGIVAVRDNRLRGFKVLFMRVHGLVLNPADSYESEWIGWLPPVLPEPLGADGRPVVGIQAMSGDDVDALGLIQLQQ